MNCFFREQHEALYRAAKPYQYVGGEFLSYNKDFKDASLRFAFVFPDKYEIGISNLGVRIIYDRVNQIERFLADRAYAPEPDFKPEFLYGVETKHPLKDFDGIGFSLQYELSYPTVLKMLEMSGVGVKNSERKEDEPIVFAGGPCAFNPLPMKDFIDVFCIGDGEDMMVEVCEVLEKTKGKSRKEKINELCKIEGCWSWGVNNLVNKRISPLTYENASTSYPIPFSGSVHDRAIVEIRRGCGRMCRFCQPGHVTLPIREREAEDIIKITKELINNTGYEEYSLLSLSSNDYSNIAEVIKELSVDFNKRKINVSLPSQRIDGFSLELANLMQSVRKAGMTLAPEAGSQRLRNVIKKNISEEQIVNAALTLYENGWSKLKFYFIAGLPTETLKDMDEMAELLSKIKYLAKQIKREKGLNYGFEITCTLSIFVPKPFTPFQWCGQTDMTEVREHINYLKEKTKHIKGLKINYHESSVSQIEAVLTRGDESLCNYIYSLYKKGCYLDAWGEFFNKDIWWKAAEELGFSLEEKAKKEYAPEERLPWDFINTGLSSEWLKNEYIESFNQPCEYNLQPTCEHKCVNCGVCSSLKTKKVLAKPYKAAQEAQKVVNVKPQDPTKANRDPSIPIYKYRLKITKKGLLRYFSHLDWQNTFHKCLQRTGLNVVYSLGFNPAMKVSMGIALPLFAESEGELVDIELYDNIQEQNLADIINPKLPEGAKVIDVKQIERSAPAVDISAHWAEYKIKPYIKEQIYNGQRVSDTFSHPLYNYEKFRYDVERVLSSESVFITKKNKKGIEKTTDFKKSIGTYRFEDDSLFIHLKTGQGSEIPALRADDLMKLVDENQIFEITRMKFLDEKLREM
ncbi:TIGR03960 family B12-binding radical SAM protein [bacterium]|nr:TIGR03960 family B12-binding radical SAM protein [bacterium]